MGSIVNTDTTPIEVTPKLFIQSKTFNFNAVLITLALISAIASYALQFNLGSLVSSDPLVAEKVTRILSFVVGLVASINMVLRFYTNTPITTDPEKASQ